MNLVNILRYICTQIKTLYVRLCEAKLYQVRIECIKFSASANIHEFKPKVLSARSSLLSFPSQNVEVCGGALMCIQMVAVSNVEIIEHGECRVQNLIILDCQYATSMWKV